MEVIREAPLLRYLRWAKKFIKLFILSLLCCSFAALLLILYLRSQPLPAVSINQTTTIYASNGEVLDTLHRGQNRFVVPLKDISPFLVQATIAIEDRSFHKHYGIDWLRLARAAYVDVIHMEKRQGASTITQQLARNLYLSMDKTWERKIKEALLAIQLELNYSKDEILEMYMNQIYYGHSAYGAQAAAQTYFGKDAKDLTLAESALLAGIPKGPSYYSPYVDFDKAKSRQQVILQAMVRSGYITPEQAEQAYAEPIKLKERNTEAAAEQAPYFRDYIANLVKNKYGIDEETFIHGGLKIHTTLDPVMQKKAEDIIAKVLPKDKPDLQVALVAMDPATGHIKAMVGGRDYTKSQYNRALSMRQPGSAFKPILYLAALQNGFTPLTQMKSEPTVFTYDNGKTYIPKNFGERYAHAYINMREAIKTSDNIYAVKTIDHLTPQKVVDQARELGITSKLQAVPSLALGTSLVSPLELNTAYVTIANKGERVKPIAITRIEDSQGNVLVEEKPEKTRVADPVASALLINLMQSVFEPGGTGHRVAGELNRPVAGKTGSTDYDAWLSGFTPQLVTTVWVGYDKNQKVDDVTEGYLSKKIWAQFMESALKDQPPALFDMPAGVVSVYIDPASGKLATEHCPNPQLFYFAKGTEPQEYCTDHLPNHETPTPLPPPDTPSFWQRMGSWWKPTE
ncbi:MULTISPECIES: transglycosylase domain-containing protein [Bacillales]|jgi:penicillin-binding protein 2D|uniref:Carboxypeptidase n=1 Tax=Brevibacillus aydinogluensis TaxID=927786 RepID=A0AA48RCE2_9BACL|nr:MULTISPECIES: PBP1A family penicillin-binding protein [Bacillales]REK60666.1 MAG: carboxypeptidase [Brevibacillus sp.]MBR8659795.1 PBP1A family penicillin-binding protein [Brevibacillus sp. NL20B1]MDT3416603.1 1A family penicillin-binding protein [Brevibacillus aydinogluensis]NNV01222.1 PBP1A family penicillin-binding protein [Brevibacillus sp. MCWH]UFJ62073.1 PBP1A family penicillin-binding protein [Anoxybacillus sediminis]